MWRRSLGCITIQWMGSQWQQCPALDAAWFDSYRPHTCQAVRAASGKAAASSKLFLSGMRASAASGSTMREV